MRGVVELLWQPLFVGIFQVTDSLALVVCVTGEGMALSHCGDQVEFQEKGPMCDRVAYSHAPCVRN